MLWIILVHIAATLLMVGIIWFVQIVHYPLFNQVEASAFRLYELGHSRLTTYVVGPTMLLELTTGAWLLWQRPATLLPLQVWLGIGLIAVIWLSTFFVQVPYHSQLEQGFNPIIHQKLVCSNWLRTLAWSARGVIVLWIAKRLMPFHLS